MRIRFQLVTPHGRPIDGADVDLFGGAVTGRAIGGGTPGEYDIDVPAQADYHVRMGRGPAADGFHHRTFRATIFALVDSEGRDGVVAHDASDGDQVSRVVAIRRIEAGVEIRVELDYLWFTPIGYPPTRGNRIALHVDGEAAWGDVADAVDAAERTVHLTSWWYQGTAEWRRPESHMYEGPEARTPFTAGHILGARAAAGAAVRLLL